MFHFNITVSALIPMLKGFFISQNILNEKYAYDL